MIISKPKNGLIWPHYFPRTDLQLLKVIQFPYGKVMLPIKVNLLKRLTVKKQFQNLLAVEGKEILAVNCTSSLKLYNTEDYSFITTINYGCPPGSAFFQFDDEHIIIGELMVNINKGTSSSIYDDPDKECSHCLKNGGKLGNGLVVMVIVAILVIHQGVNAILTIMFT